MVLVGAFVLFMFDIVLVCIGVAFVVVAMWCWEFIRHRDFIRNWPPISDDEFIAKCSPGTNRQRALKVRRIIAEQLGVPYEHIHPDQSFIEDLDGG